MNNRGRVWNVSPSVALPDHVEVGIGILGEPRKEELEEGVRVFTHLKAPIDFWSTRVLVGEPDANGLIDEEDVEVLVPTVRIPRDVLSAVRYSARSEFEQ